MPVTVSISEAQGKAEAAQPGYHRLVAELFVDYLDQVFVNRKLEGKQECKTTRFSKYIQHQCCPEHRILDQARKALAHRAEVIKPSNSRDEQVTCQRWWNSLGVDHPSDMLVIE